MTKAMLVYTNLDSLQTVTLDTGSLYYLDSITSRYNDSFDLKKLYAPRFENFENDNGKLTLYSVRDTSSKVEIPIFYDNKEEVQLRDNYYDNYMSETEKSRKLLYNSKDKMFLKSFINNSILQDTINFSIRLSRDEYKYAIKNGIPYFQDEEGKYMKLIDLFTYVSENSKIGVLRKAFEDSLDLWKSRMISKNDIDLYFYSRNLKILLKEYDKKLHRNNTINNLNVRDDKIVEFTLKGLDSCCRIGEHKYNKIKKIA